jgi:hypothetical protein
MNCDVELMNAVNEIVVRMRRMRVAFHPSLEKGVPLLDIAEVGKKMMTTQQAIYGDLLKHLSVLEAFAQRSSHCYFADFSPKWVQKRMAMVECFFADEQCIMGEKKSNKHHWPDAVLLVDVLSVCYFGHLDGLMGNRKKRVD